jgi:nitric oxide reductase subunit C
MTGKQPWRHRTFLVLMVLFAPYTVSIYTTGTQSLVSRSASASALKGQEIYRARNCVACHQTYGLGGYMGPDLTNVISDPDRGAEYARGFIQYGSNRMPNFELSEAEINNLIAYLEHMGAEGSYKPTQGKVIWNGTVDYERN